MNFLKINKFNVNKSAVKKGMLMTCISVFFAFVALFIAIMVFSYINNLSFEEKFIQITSEKVYERLRIIQISDLHGTEYGKANKKLLSRIEKLEPDIIIMTGDIIDSERKMDKMINLCENLADKYPTYYIYGNNETDISFSMDMTKENIDDRIDVDDKTRDPQKLYDLDNGLKQKIEKTGVNVLLNEYDTVKIGMNKVDIYGVLTSNPSAFWPYAKETYGEFLYDVNSNNLKVLAIHEPHIFSELSEEYWGDLAVCGHTHGGVMKIPYLGALYSQGDGFLPDRKGAYVHGKYNVDETQLVVSSGLTNKGLLRINNKPELTIIDVNRY